MSKLFSNLTNFDTSQLSTKGAGFRLCLVAQNGKCSFNVGQIQYKRIMKNEVRLQVIARTWGDGKAEVHVGTPHPNKKLFGIGICLGDTSSVNSLELMLRKADRMAGHRARQTVAQMAEEPKFS